MTTVQTLKVPHLAGSTIGYRFGRPYDAGRPTLVMINSFATSSALYEPQFEDAALQSAANLLAIEPYGHGATRSPVEQFTYWDTAHAVLQALEALGIPKAFVLGTSQGGWMAARVAMLAPEKVQGIVPLGTSMDAESAASQALGCWDAAALLTPVIDALCAPVDAGWEPPVELREAVVQSGLGTSATDRQRSFWHATIGANYRGDDGRRRLRQCAINLRERDGLVGRLDALRCPVLWLHGTEDSVYSIANARAAIERMVNAPSARLEVVQGGQHFLSATHPAEVNAATAGFIRAVAG